MIYECVYMCADAQSLAGLVKDSSGAPKREHQVSVSHVLVLQCGAVVLWSSSGEWAVCRSD